MMTIERFLEKHFWSKMPNEIIGGDKDPYMLRWFIIPRNRLMNIYLHFFLRDDDDRALHDHPWWSISIPLTKGYIEVTHNAKGYRYQCRKPLRPILRSARKAHRIALFRDNGYPVQGWSLFITGPKIRSWGFHCPKGWIHWKDFTRKTANGNEVSKGCD